MIYCEYVIKKEKNYFEKLEYGNTQGYEIPCIKACKTHIEQDS